MHSIHFVELTGQAAPMCVLGGVVIFVNTVPLSSSSVTPNISFRRLRSNNIREILPYEMLEMTVLLLRNKIISH